MLDPSPPRNHSAMSSSDPRPHVAVLTFPFGTHAPPLFSLAQTFAVAAPNAAISFFSSARANAALASPSSTAAPNLKSYDVADGSVLDGKPLPPPEEVRLFLGITPGNFVQAIAEAEKESGRISCLLSDAFLWFAADLAAEMGAKWVPVWTGGTTGHAAHIHTDLLRQTFSAVDQVEPEAPLDFIPSLTSIRVRDLPDGIVTGDLNSVFAVMLRRVALELPRASAVGFNTFEGLDPVLDLEFRNRFEKYLPIGPLSLLLPQPVSADEHGCLAWLATQGAASVVYIGFGKAVMQTPAEMAELAKGLKASGMKFLWSMKAAAMSHLPPCFLERTAGRGLILPWAPQPQVLAHPAIGAFVTHCGWNSVLESIAAGVPMIGRPFLGDQAINGRMISHVWKIGVMLEGGVVTKENLVSALAVVLKSDEGKVMRARASELKTVALQAGKPGGSSVENFSVFQKLVLEF